MSLQQSSVRCCASFVSLSVCLPPSLEHSPCWQLVIQSSFYFLLIRHNNIFTVCKFIQHLGLKGIEDRCFWGEKSDERSKILNSFWLHCVSFHFTLHCDKFTLLRCLNNLVKLPTIMLLLWAGAGHCERLVPVWQ